MNSRLFLAVWPSDEVSDLLAALPRKDQRGVRFISPDNWHITLRYLGDADPDAVIAAMGRASLPALIARLGPALDMLGTHSVVVPVGGLDRLAASVTDAVDGLGEEERRKSFHGHITVAKVKRGTIVLKVVGMMFRSEFAVERVALVESQLRPEGAVYTTLETWPVGS